MRSVPMGQFWSQRDTQKKSVSEETIFYWKITRGENSSIPETYIYVNW